MNLSAPFIHRPVATTLLLFGIFCVGAVAFYMLPVSPLPQVDFPTISISASLPGASPEIMASSVATPLERQLGHIAGVSEMTSTSSLGVTAITLQFDLDRDINGAARDVQAAINAARTYLPANLPANPSYRKVNPADAPIMILALTSKVLDRGEMYDAASTVLEQRLSQIQGVGQVIVGGSSLPAVRVEVNPLLLNHFGLGMTDVAKVLSAQNANRPKGQLANERYTADITANDQLTKASEYRPLVVGYHDGAAIQLADVAEVTDSVQDLRSAGYMNGEPSVLMIIFRAPGANIIDTVDRVRRAFPQLKASIPAAIDLTTVLDRTTTIRASVHDVESTLVISILLVILVVFAFLRDWRTTLIPSVAVPISLIGTFAVMYLLGYSLDNLSLMALTISTGFVVDDAIVVIENITRYFEKGLPPVEASLKGAKEIGFTVLTISISLIAVFIPILLMGGIVGRLFREFAVTLSVAILVSLVISLTATPMMCSRLMKKLGPRGRGKFYRWSEAVFDRVLGFYERTLAVVIRHPAITLGVLLATIVLNGYLFVKIPKGFFPLQDNGTVYGGMQGEQDISFQAMNKLVQEFVGIVKDDPAVDHVMAFTGGRGSTNGGFMYLELKPRSKRKASASEVINRLRPKFAGVAGASVFLQAGQDVRIGGRQSNAQYQYTLQSDNVRELERWGPVVLREIKKLPGLTDVNSDQQNNGLVAGLDYDRLTAARLGVTPQLMDHTLYDSFGQAPVSKIYTSLNQYFVVMEVARPFAQNPQALASTYVHAPGGIVPMTALSRMEPRTAALTVNHQGQFPSVTVSFNLAPGVSLGTASDRINEMEQKIGLPPTIRGKFAGTLEAFQKSLASEELLIITALIAVYIVLGMLYESYVHPITILSTLPSAGVGAALALLIFGLDMSVVALIGVILLIGIVKKNAILMIDFALEAERGQGKKTEEAIFQACLLRFRPILMTTMAALFGAVPLAFGTGNGSELRRPLGVAIIGGLVFSQALTLYTTPVVYLCMDRFRFWFQSRVLGRRGSHAWATAVLVIGLFGLMGCAAGPKYKTPAAPVPTEYKEAVAVADWQPAKPEDAAKRGKWWETFQDPELNRLEEQGQTNNQNVQAAIADLKAARALVREARASFFPTVNAAPSYTRQHLGPFPGQPPANTRQFTAPLQASWEPDLFGRVQNTVAQRRAQVQVSAADLENARLIQAADLATTYFQLRNQDSLIALYESTLQAYRQVVDLTKVLYKTGIDSEEAVSQAETQLATTEAQATGLKIARAQLEHALALLVGKPPAQFSLAAASLNAAPPVIPVGVPSQLLERRPDIAAAERTVAAMNAQIGIAQSAYFPALNLSGQVGYESSTLSGLFHAPALIWSLGAALTETIFDGGLRRATVEESRANYDKSVALYRQTVLTAFGQVEDGLAGLHLLNQQMEQEDAALKSAQHNMDIALSRFRLGLDPFLNVITAQLSLLQAEQASLGLRLQRLTTSVALIEALGGGWDRGQLK